MTEFVSGPAGPLDEPVTYDPAAVEAKWRDRWSERATNVANIDGAKRPYYALMMFPYPSAAFFIRSNIV